MHLTLLGSAVTTAALARMVDEDLGDQLILPLLELIDNGVVQWILVLLEPSAQVVRHLVWERKVRMP